MLCIYKKTAAPTLRRAGAAASWVDATVMSGLGAGWPNGEAHLAEQGERTAADEGESGRDEDGFHDRLSVGAADVDENAHQDPHETAFSGEFHGDFGQLNDLPHFNLLQLRFLVFIH